MDTRTKIVSPERALEIAAELRGRGVRFRVVTGYFDVLHPAFLRRLQADGNPLFAIVMDPSEALLTAAARVELAASLRMIDYVIHWEGDPGPILLSLAPGACIHEEAAHSESTERLIQHVFERHGRTFERRRQN